MKNHAIMSQDEPLNTNASDTEVVCVPPVIQDPTSKHRFIVSLSNDEQLMIRVRMRPRSQIKLKSQFVLYLSIHSQLYANYIGFTKVVACLAALRSQISGEISLVLCEYSHVHTRSLLHEGCIEKSIKEARKDALTLESKLLPFANDFKILHWHDLIINHPSYLVYNAYLMNLLKENDFFRQKMHLDTERHYTNERSSIYPDFGLYQEKAISDLIEQHTGRLILNDLGFEKEIYLGGTPNKSFSYLVHYQARDFTPIILDISSPQFILKEH